MTDAFDISELAQPIADLYDAVQTAHNAGVERIGSTGVPAGRILIASYLVMKLAFERLEAHALEHVAPESWPALDAMLRAMRSSLVKPISPLAVVRA